MPSTTSPMPQTVNPRMGLCSVFSFIVASSGSIFPKPCIVVARKLEHHYPHALKVHYNWALEYRTLILFFLRNPYEIKSLYFFLSGYFKAQIRNPSTNPPKAMFQLSGFYYNSMQASWACLRSWVPFPRDAAIEHPVIFWLMARKTKRPSLLAAAQGA